MIAISSAARASCSRSRSCAASRSASTRLRKYRVLSSSDGPAGAVPFGTLSFVICVSVSPAEHLEQVLVAEFAVGRHGVLARARDRAWRGPGWRYLLGTVLPASHQRPHP